MMADTPAVDSESDDLASAHFVHSLMQFAMAVRHRKNIVIVCLAVALLLGALYYATATRYYSAEAGLLVLQVGSQTWSAESTQRSLEKTVLPTYEGLIVSTKVIEGALALLQPQDRIDLAGVSRENWANVLRGNLRVKAIRNTNIIKVSYESKDPNAAVAVVDAVVRSYLNFSAETYKTTAGEIIQILGKEKNQLAEQMARKNEELLQARRALGDMGLPVDSKVLHPLAQRAVSLNEDLIKAQTKRIELEATLAALQAAVRNGGDLQQYVFTVASVVGEQLLLSNLGFTREDAQTQGDLQRDLLTYKGEMRNLQNHLGPAHPKVAALADKIRETEQYLLGYQDRVRERLEQLENSHLGPMLIDLVQQKTTQAWQLESSLGAQFNQAQAEAVALNDRLAQVQILEHDLNWLRELHDVMLNRMAGLELKNEGLDVRTTVVDEPVVRKNPVSPKLVMTFLLCLLAGLGVGLLAVYLLDVLDDHFRSVEELQAILGVPALAMVQQLPASESVGVETLQIIADPEASQSEAFRTLRTALLLSNQDTRKIVVSSSEPGDGKTTVLANLAAALAQSQKKTLLIDADLRRPGLTAMLGLRGVEGLSGIIHGQLPVASMAAQHIQTTALAGLDVLPSGPRPTNPAELLASPRFAELLAWAELAYDHVLIDSPPALAASDTAVIGRLVDGVMLVVQPAKNHRRVLIRTVKSFSMLKIPVLGVVVNRVDAGKSYYYGYDGSYHYDYQSYDDSEIEFDDDFAPDDEIAPRRVA
ncbi:MAG: polysaccharide biosynthesis tyrosine autokinase [Pirellulales bacterium]|nr:polysaccharide biosynthesis tyrosine autokinase [Pirellulales bacterium]